MSDVEDSLMVEQEDDYFDKFDAPQFCDFVALANCSHESDKEAQEEADKFFGIHKEPQIDDNDDSEAFVSAENLTPTIGNIEYSLISDCSLSLNDSNKENDCSGRGDIDISLPYQTPMGKDISTMIRNTSASTRKQMQMMDMDTSDIVYYSNYNQSNNNTKNMTYANGSEFLHTPSPLAYAAKEKSPLSRINNNSIITPENNTYLVVDNTIVNTNGLLEDKPLDYSIKSEKKYGSSGNYFLRDSLVAQLEKLDVDDGHEDNNDTNKDQEHEETLTNGFVLVKETIDENEETLTNNGFVLVEETIDENEEIKKKEEYEHMIDILEFEISKSDEELEDDDELAMLNTSTSGLPDPPQDFYENEHDEEKQEIGQDQSNSSILQTQIDQNDSYQKQVQNESHNLSNLSPSRIEESFFGNTYMPSSLPPEPYYKESEENGRLKSLYIASSTIGKEVFWGSPQVQVKQNEIAQEELVEKLDSFDKKSSLLFKMSPMKGKDLRRASSCSDIYKLIEPKTKHHEVFGFIPRVGITIPKTPDTCHRRQPFSRLAKSKLANANKPKIECQPKLKIPIRTQTFSAFDNKTKGLMKNNYVSLAEQVNKFQRATPNRYHSAPKNYIPARSKSQESNSNKGHSPSPPRGPQLQTELRARQRNKSNSSTNSHNVSVSSTTSASATNMINHYQTNYQPKRVVSQQSVQKMNIKQNVLPLKKFDFKKTLYMPAYKPEPKQQEPEKFEFKARPAPLKIFQGPTGVSQKQHLKPTSPISPFFMIEARLRERHEREREKQEKKSAASTPAISPKILKPSRIPTPLKPKGPTTIEPFSFEQRDQDMRKRRQEKLLKEIHDADKHRVFSARPLPSFDTVKLPPKPETKITEVVPFHLSSDAKAPEFQLMMRQKKLEEEKRLKDMRAFHAHDALVLHKPAFEPEHKTRFIEPLNIVMNSDKRAKERELYDQQLREREKAEEEKKLKEQERNEELEKRKEVAFRQMAESFRAKPFKEIPVFKLKETEKPLTVPQSPAFKPLPSIRRKFYNPNNSE